jgi:hypothetical protein
MCIRINLYHLIVKLTKWLTYVEYKFLKIDCVKFLLILIELILQNFTNIEYN